MGLNVSPSGGVTLPISVANGGTGQTTLTSLPLVTPILGTPTSGLLVNTTIGSEDTLTAHAGGTQAAALVLSAVVCYHRITVCATAADSVIFGAVAAAGGMPHTIRNDGAAYLQVFGSGTDTINGIATATGISIPPGVAATFYQSAANKWTTTPGAGPLLALEGAVATPGFAFGIEPGLGFYRSSATNIRFASGGVSSIFIGPNNFVLEGNNSGTISTATTGGFSWNGAGTTKITGVTAALTITSNGLASAVFTSVSGPKTSLNLNGAVAAADTLLFYVTTVTAIADNTATAVATVTIPNAAHGASIKVRLTGHAGAGGAIGADEATTTVEYIIAVARTAGVNAVAGISASIDTATASVAGGTVFAATAALSAISGAVGASNTFTINATLAHTLGSSTNHTCDVFVELHNARATGITIA